MKKPDDHSMTYFEVFMSAARAANVDGTVYGRDDLVDPPNPDYGYWATPVNSVTFASLGVDGVHTAIITEGGKITDDSPVAYVTPMDDPPVVILAATIMDFLADGCGIDRQEMIEMLDRSSQDPHTLIRFVDSNFDMGRLLDDDRITAMNETHLNIVEMKPFPEATDLD